MESRIIDKTVIFPNKEGHRERNREHWGRIRSPAFAALDPLAVLGWAELVEAAGAGVGWAGAGGAPGSPSSRVCSSKCQ